MCQKRHGLSKVLFLSKSHVHKSKIVKQTPIGAPANPINGAGDAKTVPPAQMIGGLIEMVTRPHSWMFVPLLLTGIALLSTAIILGAIGE